MKKENSMPLFGIVSLLKYQNELVGKYCFDICGKLIIGGIRDVDIGCMFVCQQLPEDCMCFDKQTDNPLGEVNGRPVYLRKLHSLIEEESGAT